MTGILIRPSLFLLLFSVCALAWSKEQTITLEIGVSMSIPPWVMKETDSGIELDILHAAFTDSPYEIKPVYVPFALAFQLFSAGKLDGVINAKPEVAAGGYLSDPVVTLQNVAVSLRHKQFPPDFPIRFMHDKKVIAFQRAKDLLGEDFRYMTQRNTRYEEIGKQSLQINLLFIRDADFIVMDRSIFGYYWQQALESASPDVAPHFRQAVTLHYVFEPSPYQFLFKQESMRDLFNARLKSLHENGRYAAILDQYDHLQTLYEQTSDHALTRQ